MVWQIPVALAVIFGYIVHPYVNKKIANDENFKIAKLGLFPFFALVLSLLLFLFGKLSGLVSGSIVVNSDIFFLLLISLLNPVANYFHWQALKTHQSLTAVFTWLDDLVCMVLGYIILSEGKFLTFNTALGMLMVFSAVVIFSASFGTVECEKCHKRFRAGQIDIKKPCAVCGAEEVFITNNGPLRGVSKEQLQNLIFAVVKYSIIWGVVMFLMRFFALRGMRWFEFVPTWYLGSCFGAVVLFALSDKNTRGNAADLRPYLPVCFLMGLSALVSMLLMYWVRSLPNLPILATQPIFQASEMILPTLIGLYVYHEKKTFNWLGWVAMGLGLVGGLIIAFSF